MYIGIAFWTLKVIAFAGVLFRSIFVESLFGKKVHIWQAAKRITFEFKWTVYALLILGVLHALGFWQFTV